MDMLSSRPVFYATALVAGLVGGVGDVYINRWAKNVAGVGSLVFGLLLCNTALGLFVSLLRRGSFASCVVVFLVANSLLAVVVNQMVLTEPLSRLRVMGVLVALVGVVMVELG